MLEQFRPETARWFREALGEPTPVQKEAWQAVRAGKNVLISAPTGTGKTLSAFLVLLDRLKKEAEAGRPPEGVQAVYISPLRSLAADIRENLTRPLEGMGGPSLTTGMRTGDTPSGQRQKMLNDPPHIFITTPESLYILLCTQRGRAMLRTARWVIVDELHALMSTKRGAHLALSLARLDRLCPAPPQRIGLSATIEPLSLAADWLSPREPARIVAPKMEKRTSIAVTGVLDDMRILPEGSIWPELARRIVDLCRDRRAAIAFVEGRAQAERLAGAVNDIAGEGFALSHHGSVSREKRQEAEAALRGGRLRLLCATSSMELGIDVGDVDLVVQVGCPLTVSAALQRMGRSGHDPSRTSVMRIFPKTASDGVYCGLTAAAALRGQIEPAHPPRQCLDVLAQHLVSMASEGGYTVEEALETACGAWPTRDLVREDITSLLEMLSGDWEHREDRPARPRVLYDRLHGAVTGDEHTRLLALSSGGAIPDRGLYPCFLRDGKRVGELDEEFVFEARIGDRFLLGAFAWRIEEIHRDRVIVSAASTGGAQIPFWRGDGVGRAYSVSLKFGETLRALAGSASLEDGLTGLTLDEAAARNAARHLRRQMEITGCLPDDRTLIFEHFSDEAGEHQLMVHSLFGRRVNYGLSLLLQQAAQAKLHTDVRAWDDDNGTLLYTAGDQDIPDGLIRELDPDKAEDMLRALLPATSLFFMAFRYNAARALMMGARSGRRQALWVQRLRGADALGEAVKDPNHPLMRETMRECLEDYLDLEALREVLRGARSGRVALRELRTRTPSPMTLPMRRQVEAEMLYDYAPIPSAAKRASREAVEKALGSGEGIAPAPELLRPGEGRPPQSMDQLHSRLMTEGDFLAEEMAAPPEWISALARAGRCAYTESGLWIAAEEQELYGAARDGDRAARLRIVRRCLRFRGPQDGESIRERYGWEDGKGLLDELSAQGTAVLHEGLYYHRDIFAKAQRETVLLRRSQVETLPSERYAALLARGLRRPGRPGEQTDEALSGLKGAAFALRAWEERLLPARVERYQPRLLDEAIARGSWIWQVTEGGKELAFYAPEDADYDAPPHWKSAEGLDEDETALLRALEKRGASFAASLSPLTREPAAEVLLALARKGLVRADSFAPIRALLALEDREKLPARALARLRASVMQAGRWELTRPMKEKTEEEYILDDFRERRILCRETARRLPWSRAIETLRLWEYTRKARRGYFVEGLSGIQFIRQEDYESVLAGLREEDREPVWLCAADPSQAWGSLLPHREGRSFLCVPGTAVCLTGGAPSVLLEKGGEILRVLDGDAAPAAFRALAREFRQGCLFPGRAKLTVRQGAEGFEGPMEDAGFVRDGLYMTLWKDM